MMINRRTLLKSTIASAVLPFIPWQVDPLLTAESIQIIAKEMFPHHAATWTPDTAKLCLESLQSKNINTEKQLRTAIDNNYDWLMKIDRFYSRPDKDTFFRQSGLLFSIKG